MDARNVGTGPCKGVAKQRAWAFVPCDMTETLNERPCTTYQEAGQNIFYKELIVALYNSINPCARNSTVRINERQRMEYKFVVIDLKQESAHVFCHHNGFFIEKISIY